MELEIYFSDLNEESQKEVLDFYGISAPDEGNFDLDIFPLATLHKNLPG